MDTEMDYQWKSQKPLIGFVIKECSIFLQTRILINKCFYFLSNKV